MYPGQEIWIEVRFKLEEYIPKILAKLEYLGHKNRLERIEKRKEWAIREEELIIEREKQNKIERKDGI